jgi:hypothetical protein
VRRLALAMALVAAPALADGVTGSIQNGYGRLSFTTASKVSATASGGVLTISFADKTSIDPAAVVAAMSKVIASGHADADGKTLRFVLNQPVKLHVSNQPGRAVVDMADESFNGTMPDLAPPPKPVAKPLVVADLPEIKLRAGSYANFTRLVFDWPKDVSYQVFPGAGKMTIKFNTLARADVSVIARFAPPWVKNAAWRIDGSSTIVEFETDSDSGFHDFKDGTHVVLDVLAPKTDSAAYAPPGIAKPTVTKMTAASLSPAKTDTAKPATTPPAAPPAKVAAADTPKPAPAKPAATPATPIAAKGVTAAQAQAITKTATALNPPKPDAPKPDDKKPDAKAADAKPADTKTADATPQPPAAPAIPVADGHRTRDGVLIHFRGAGMLPTAVFVRGLTAWVVVENAPKFDSHTLKTSLGDFATGVEAVSSNGLGILRIGLKAPMEIGARSNGPILDIEIAPKVAPPDATITFARSQNGTRAALSTLLASADHAFPIPDPGAADILTVIPAMTGSGVANKREFADFAILPSAAGLIVTPYADDVQVGVDTSRVSIARPGGLMLTPPQMPVAQSPGALAHFGDGPSYLNFALWGQASAGSFLATQRALIQSSAKAGPALAGLARLNLARFYLANGFAAEALGLINLVTSNDPSLSGDAQIITMKAAAEYMMGRYTQAHNDLAGPQFDSDRHAAFWRGMIEAGMEDWKNAHAHLDQAAPVLNRYTGQWQANAILADANAALGMNRLDLADAVMTRIPKTLDKRQALQAELVEARLMAGESRYGAAVEHFNTVESSGDEKLAAEAIYWHTNAALTAGALSVPQAIEQLEKLRFRWRGDQLEMKTLRRLAALYFGRGQWREGLKTLHIATQNFTGDGARTAQDDMRTAFVNLYLKGGADKMKPVDSLALFYDNIDLTPIGPDGDEMIRRMSDRLVAVDLLGPAASLLAYQVDKRLEGVAKAQVATKLASVYLMDHKPDKAVAAIRDSQITGLPDDEMHARLLLEARAFAALKQWDNALDLVAVDQSEDVKRLRADIYWESGNWAVAGQKAEEMLAGHDTDAAPLTEAERAGLLRATVAYSLANDEAALERLRAHFGAKMKGTPDANIFAVLSERIDLHGLAFRDAAAKIASVDTLQAFMKDFSKRREAKS